MSVSGLSPHRRTEFRLGFLLLVTMIWEHEARLFRGVSISADEGFVRLWESQIYPLSSKYAYWSTKFGNFGVQPQRKYCTWLTIIDTIDLLLYLTANTGVVRPAPTATTPRREVVPAVVVTKHYCRATPPLPAFRARGLLSVFWNRFGFKYTYK